MLEPGVGEAGHRIGPRQAHGCFLVAELLRGTSVAVGQLLIVGPPRVGLRHALLAIGVDARENRAKEGGNGDRCSHEI